MFVGFVFFYTPTTKECILLLIDGTFFWVCCIIMLSMYLWCRSAVKAHQFFTEESWEGFKQIFDAYLFEASKVLFKYFIFL